MSPWGTQAQTDDVVCSSDLCSDVRAEFADVEARKAIGRGRDAVAVIVALLTVRDWKVRGLSDPLRPVPPANANGVC